MKKTCQAFSSHKSIRFQSILIATLACVFLLLIGSSYALGAGFKLQSIRGKVEIQRGGKANWTALRPGVREASDGDRIRTGDGSSVYIISDDGARAAIGPKTQIVLREPNQPRGWRVIAGKVKTSFVGSRRLEVRTPGAIAAAEGTTFQVEVAENGTSVLTVVEGAVLFFNELGSEKVLASQQSIAEVGKAPTRPILVDAGTLTAWEASVQSLMIPFEYPLVATDREVLARELGRRQTAADGRPQDASAQADLAEALFDLHKTEEAVARAQKSVELAPDVKRFHGVLAFALLQAGRPAEAEEEFGKAASSDETGARWLLGLALVEIDKGDIKKGIELIDEAVKAAPNDAYMQAYVGAAKLREGDLNAADASVSNAVKLGPDNYVANTYLAYVKLAQGQLDAAVAAARKAAKLAPQSTMAHEALGNALVFAGQSTEARQELDRAIELDPLSAGAHLALAKLMAAGGELDGALQEAQVAVSLDPQSGPARSTLGLLYLLNKDPIRAEKQFKAALAADPSLSDARTGWGRVLQQRGRFREAIEQQKLAVSADTDSASALNNLGGVYASTGQMDIAEEHLNQAIQLQPGWGLPYANLAVLRLEENRIREALDAAEKAVALGERSAFAHTVLARVYLKQGRTDRALSELREAVALDDTYPQAHYQLSRLYLQGDRSRDAVREILYAVTRDPSSMLETRSYARTESKAYGGSNKQAYIDLRHSGQAWDGRLSYYLSGLASDSNGWRDINQNVSEKFGEVIVGHQSQPAQQIVFFGTVMNQKAGLPGPVTSTSLGDSDDKRDFNGLQVVLALRQRLSPKATGTFKYSAQNARATFLNPDSMSALDDNPFLRLNNRSEQQSPEIRLDADLSEKLSFSAGYARVWDKLRQCGLSQTFDPAKGVLTPGAFVEPATNRTDTSWFELRGDPDEKVQLTFGGYWGRETGTPGKLLPKFIALFRPDKSQWWSFAVSPLLHADAAELSPVEALADPKGLSYLDLADGGVGRSYELRYQWHGRRSSTVSASAAYQDIEDLLVNLDDPALTGTPRRALMDEGRRWVADTSYEQWLGDKITGRVWARWQSTAGRFPAEFVTGREWPYTPMWQGGGRLDYIDASGWRVGLEAVGLGKRFDDPDNAQRLSASLLFNLRLQYQRTLRENYFLSVFNVGNRYYEDFTGFPQSGRAFIAGLDYRY